jgi:hypothetical protein
MFLAAVLRGPGLSAPVKVRNMSATGALVEGAAVPPGGANIQLMRGSLVVPAIVAWSQERRCGLHFSSLVCVRDWIAPRSNTTQDRVDETVRLLKLGALPMPRSSPAQGDDSTPSSVQLGEDLLCAARLIEDLGEHLSIDVETLVRHGEKLQNLDIALQTIAAVVQALKGQAEEGAVAARMENLRSSCAAALKKSGASTLPVLSSGTRAPSA